MAEITAADVKRLREATGAGMMDCKKALSDTDGDFDAAVDLLRTKGMAKAAKRGAERTASNGLVAASEGALIELACETDFVAKNEQFQQLAADIAAHAAAVGIGEVEKLLGETLADGRSVSENIESLNAVIGEKIELRRAAFLDGQVASYMHRRASDLPPQVGVLVEFEGDDLNAARGVAMQIAALRAQYVSRDEVPEDVIERERRVAEATAREEGKPDAALPKIVEGRVQGFYKEVALLEQSSVQDSKQTVKQMLEAAGVTVRRFVRFEVGQA
ncbi:MAG TPA: translation elongation factor Ts [Mycobacteriales bacterium]|nr:translation elongation factor Ts [Mycobacteriales bacterium]